MAQRSLWPERISAVTAYIQSHLDEELDAVTLAGVAGFSLHHFHRIFRGIVGESVMEYTRRLRLEQAAVRLKYGEEPVVDVALRAGYGSHEAFTRAFAARFGTPPSDYRASARQELPGEASFRLVDRAAVTCLSLRYTGPYEGCGAAWEELFAAVGRYGIPLVPDAPTVGLCHDDPEVTAPDRCRYDACVATRLESLPAELPARLERRIIPGGRYAQALHQGSYAHILETYVALLGNWLPKKDVDLPDDPVVEVYLNSPISTPEPDLQTLVLVRLSEAAVRTTETTNG